MTHFDFLVVVITNSCKLFMTRVWSNGGIMMAYYALSVPTKPHLIYYVISCAWCRASKIPGASYSNKYSNNQYSSRISKLLQLHMEMELEFFQTPKVLKKSFGGNNVHFCYILCMTSINYL